MLGSPPPPLQCATTVLISITDARSIEHNDTIRQNLTGCGWSSTETKGGATHRPSGVAAESCALGGQSGEDELTSKSYKPASLEVKTTRTKAELNQRLRTQQGRCLRTA